MTLENYLVTKFAQVIQSWPPDLAQDIYALSLYRDDNNVPYRPAIYLAYNTQSQLKQQEQSHPPAEAKWNLALWQHDDWVGIEDKREQEARVHDEEGTRTLDAWLKESSDNVVQAFASLCVRVARQLHATGVIRRTFGRDIPIIMHDDDWDDATLRNTEAANPASVAQAFLDAEVF